MKPPNPQPGHERAAASGEQVPYPVRVDVWELVFSASNLQRAVRRVKRNGGAPGVDGITVDDLGGHLRRVWPDVRRRLDAGTFKPAPLRRIKIPKPGGGVRLLGVPTVLDRMIQQALLQVLQPIFDPFFSDHSYGFRPSRSAHQAVNAARRYVQDDLRVVVDVDLDRFFDRVNHDVLMARVARRVEDKRVLRLLGAFLRAGVMVEGVCVQTGMGTPQGGPISPLLANIMLDDLDKELERRGHRFVRYADDLAIFVATPRAGQRVFDSVATFVEKRLRLRVNRDKSKVGPASNATLLGFGFLRRGDGISLRIDSKAKRKAKDRIRRLTARNWGVSMTRRINAINVFVRGWVNYFGIAATPSVFAELDEWLRRRLRQVAWKQWRKPRTRIRNLRLLGIPEQRAYEWGYSGKGPWRIAGSAPLQRALPNRHWTNLGLLTFSETYRRVQKSSRTAGCGPACPVVW